MNKTKLLLSVVTFQLLGLLSYGQSVGINNTSPKATLDITAKSANTDNKVEGLLIPRVSKNKAFLMAGNAELKASTMIYIDSLTDYTTTPADAKVADITEKGYYFWNGTKWVKSVGSSGELWGTKAINGVSTSFLNPALFLGDSIAYKNRKINFNLGGYKKEYAKWSRSISSTINYDRFHIDGESTPFQFLATSDALPKVKTGISVNDDNEVYYFMNNGFEVLENHVSSLSRPSDYWGNLSFLETNENVTSKVGSMSAVYAKTYHGGSGNILNLYGASIVAQNGSLADNITPTLTGSLRGISVYSSNAGNAYVQEGARIATENFGNSTSPYGVRVSVSNYGTADNIRGIYNVISSQSKPDTNAMPAHTVNILYGVDNVVTVAENATVKAGTNGIRSASFFSKNSTTPVHYGIYNYSGVSAGANVERLYGARYAFVNDSTAKIGEMYGLYIDNVAKGTTKSYAIYTGLGKVHFGDNVGVGVGTPAEKLEVAGKVKATQAIFTNLPVYVDDDAADADTNLPSGSLYKLQNMGRQVFVKP